MSGIQIDLTISKSKSKYPNYPRIKPRGCDQEGLNDQKCERVSGDKSQDAGPKQRNIRQNQLQTHSNVPSKGKMLQGSSTLYSKYFIM